MIGVDSMLKFIGVAGLSVIAMHARAVAGGDLFDDLFAPYLERRDTVTPGGGNAKDTNAAAHVIDPWPPLVGARNIPSDGKRAADAVRRYRQGPADPAATADTANPAALPIPTGLMRGDASAASSGRH
jgi:type IV pilus biogenesis protein CpaD/CtpE